MSPGERRVASLSLKSRFYDRHEQRAYGRAIEIARRIVDDPSAISNARRFLEEHVLPDPHQMGTYELWTQILTLPRKAIAIALLEDSHRGEELRGTAPVFVVLGSDWQGREPQRLS